jgi:hypothetical protein
MAGMELGREDGGGREGEELRSVGSTVFEGERRRRQAGGDRRKRERRRVVRVSGVVATS